MSAFVFGAWTYTIEQDAIVTTSTGIAGYARLSFVDEFGGAHALEFAGRWDDRSRGDDQRVHDVAWVDRWFFKSIRGDDEDRATTWIMIDTSRFQNTVEQIARKIVEVRS